MKIKMLIIDPDLLYAKTIASIFKVFSCDVRLASNIAAAVKIIESDGAHVIVMGEATVFMFGAGLRTSLEAAGIPMCIAVVSSRIVPASEMHPLANAYLHPSRFFSDLLNCLVSSRIVFSPPPPKFATDTW